MVKLFFLAALGIICVTGWQWLTGVMEREELRTIMQDTIDLHQKQSKRVIVQKLIEKANEKGISLEFSETDAKVIIHDKGGVASALTSKHGIHASNKKITLSTVYHYKILSFPFQQTIEIEKNYTHKATLKNTRKYD